MKTIIIAVSLLLGVAFCWLAAYRFADKKDAAHDAQRFGSFRSENRIRTLRILGDRGWVRKSVSQPKMQPTAAQSNALSKAFLSLSAAYADANVDSLDSLFARIPPEVTNVTDGVFSGLSKSLYRRVYDEFWHLGTLHEFANVEEFRTYCRKHISVSRFLGNVRLLRQEYGSTLSHVEADVLLSLNRYGDYFRQSNREKLCQCVTEFKADWIMQIESPGGFTRQYMLADVALQLLPCNDDVDVSCERLLESVRHGADGLISAGYTPKWLAEFTIEFPLPPEDGTGRK